MYNRDELGPSGKRTWSLATILLYDHSANQNQKEKKNRKKGGKGEVRYIQLGTFKNGFLL